MNNHAKQEVASSCPSVSRSHEANFLLHATLIIIITAASFATCVGNRFLNWDDDLYVTSNEDIRGFDPEHLRKIFTSQYVGNYQPVTMLSYALDYRIAGLNPAWYHAVNIGLHILCALLAWRWARYLTSSSAAALAAGLLFGVHPLRVESVAWIAARKDLLCAFFFFSALISWERFCIGRQKIWYLLALALHALALLSKSMAVSLPVVLFLLQILPGRSQPIRTSAKLLLPFFILSLLASGAAWATQYAAHGVNPLADVGFLTKILAPFDVLQFHAAKAALPIELCAFYPWPAGLTPGILAGPVTVILVSWILYRSQHRLLQFAWLFFIFTLLPVAQIIPIGNTITADRYFYIPGFASGIILGAATDRYRLGKALLPAIVLLLGIMSFERCLVWRSSVTLWEDAMMGAPNSSLVSTNLAQAYVEAGNPISAIRAASLSIRQNPSLPNAWIVRGHAFRILPDYNASIADYTRALEMTGPSARTLNNRGVVWMLKGEPEKARQDFEGALKVDPSFRLAQENIKMIAPASALPSATSR